MLAWIAGLAALASVLYDADLVATLRDEEVLVPEARNALASTTSGFRTLALVAFGVAVIAAFARRPRTRRGLGLIVAFAFGAALVTALELITGPLAPPMTTIFAPHASRGWALVPGASDEWMGVPVTINDQGMRGPARAIPKPEGVQRVLFLGDSVTFGFQLEDDAATYPARTEFHLNERSSAPVEALNAGVGGYSPWQEVRLLAEDGLQFELDVVVVGFVLNDVSEKLGLQRYGGSGRGFQLEHSRALHGMAWRSSTVRYLLRKRAEDRGAGDAFDRAGDSVAPTISDLLSRPDDPAVRQAWDRTLPELGRIVGFCRPRKIPVLLVAFPYTVQLEHPELDAPQRRLAEFAKEQGVEVLDLAPAFRSALAANGGDLDALFLDALHLTPAGCDLAAREVAKMLVDGLYLSD